MKNLLKFNSIFEGAILFSSSTQTILNFDLQKKKKNPSLDKIIFTFNCYR